MPTPYALYEYPPSSLVASNRCFSSTAAWMTMQALQCAVLQKLQDHLAPRSAERHCMESAHTRRVLNLHVVTLMSELSACTGVHTDELGSAQTHTRPMKSRFHSDRNFINSLLESSASAAFHLFNSFFVSPARHACSFQSNLSQRAHPQCYTGTCLLYTSPSPRDRQKSRMPSSA